MAKNTPFFVWARTGGPKIAIFRGFPFQRENLENLGVGGEGSLFNPRVGRRGAEGQNRHFWQIPTGSLEKKSTIFSQNQSNEKILPIYFTGLGRGPIVRTLAVSCPGWAEDTCGGIFSKNTTNNAEYYM